MTGGACCCLTRAALRHVSQKLTPNQFSARVRRTRESDQAAARVGLHEMRHEKNTAAWRKEHRSGPLPPPPFPRAHSPVLSVLRARPLTRALSAPPPIRPRGHAGPRVVQTTGAAGELSHMALRHFEKVRGRWRPPKRQISRRYHMHPHVNVLTKHV